MTTTDSIMIRIVAHRFTAAIIVKNDTVIKAAPILRYMEGWQAKTAIGYFNRHNWKWEIVGE